METTTMNKVYKVFPGGKFKVLTFSYDDGKTGTESVIIAAPAL